MTTPPHEPGGTPPAALPSEVQGALERMGMLAPGETPRCAALPGGVSSDIWRVELARGPVCVKRALPQLRVAAEWRAPVERNRYEVAWFRVAGDIVPTAVPEILGEDAPSKLFVMQYLDPADYRLWKEQLRTGIVNWDVAAAVGDRLARIHAGTAGDEEVAEGFATDAIFHAIRLEPYLLATARVHPDRAEALTALAEVTAATKRALVHGDVSPKNILVGRDGPLFLDAECAWYGDPAFDLAFCLNHLLLKCLWVPRSAADFLDAFDVLAYAYLRRVRWEPRKEFEARAAHLLPGLLLARVDGKSPVEYLTAGSDRNRVRKVARKLLARPVASLLEVRNAWADEMGL